MRSKLQCGHTVLHEGCECCLALQAEWYSALQMSGFDDAENTQVVGRPLKTWTGISIQVVPKGSDEAVDVIDLIAFQAPNAPFQSAMPDNPSANQERLLHHPEFEALCQSICGHGNHKGTPDQVRVIWESYIEGNSNRAIAGLLSVNDTFVWRTVNTLTQWMELMDLDETQDSPVARVVLRQFKPPMDEPFIYASWRNALWYDDDERKEGDSDKFYRGATDSIRNILKNPEARVRIACLDDSANFIVGYSVSTGLYLHFVYVKADYRNKGIGTLLVPKDIDSVSPVMTKIGRAIAIKKKFIKENASEQTERVEE